MLPDKALTQAGWTVICAYGKMDSLLDSLKAGGVSATLILVVAVAFKLVTSICGHRLRSECCGRVATAAISVEPTTPPERPAVSV